MDFAKLLRRGLPEIWDKNFAKLAESRQPAEVVGPSAGADFLRAVEWSNRQQLGMVAAELDYGNKIATNLNNHVSDVACPCHKVHRELPSPRRAPQLRALQPQKSAIRLVQCGPTAKDSTSFPLMDERRDNELKTLHPHRNLLQNYTTLSIAG